MIPNLIKIDNNFYKVRMFEADYYFSYETLVAFKPTNKSIIACENIYSKTTGKHLNLISDKKDRIGYNEFLVELQKLKETE